VVAAFATLTVAAAAAEAAKNLRLSMSRHLHAGFVPDNRRLFNATSIAPAVLAAASAAFGSFG